MAGVIGGFKGGLSGSSSYEVGGRKVVCPHCGGEEFDASTALLNTAGLTFLKLDWANRSAHTLMCLECSHIEWFVDEPTLV